MRGFIFFFLILELSVVWECMKKEKKWFENLIFSMKYLNYFITHSSALLPLCTDIPSLLGHQKDTHTIIFFCGWWSSKTWFPYLCVFWRQGPVCTDSYFFLSQLYVFLFFYKEILLILLLFFSFGHMHFSFLSVCL